ncbi:MAG: hypothetical protein SNG81_04340 [Rikenellaceae bacterium]
MNRRSSTRAESSSLELCRVTRRKREQSSLKLINFNAKLSQVNQKLLKKCRESGYNPDSIDLSENTEIEFIDTETIKVRYLTTNYLAYAILILDGDLLSIDKVEVIKLK